MYTVQNPINSAFQGMSQAAGSYGAMMKDIEPPGKTAGGAMMNAAGGAMMGNAIGGSVLSGAATMGIGAALGIGAYLLS